jgi:glucose dehydrogenase
VQAPQPQRTGIVAAVVVALVGLAWIAQGLGAPIGGSFMVGDLRWSIAGAVLVLVGALLARRAFRR